MIYRVVFSEAAVADLYAIIDFIARDNPRWALSFVEELQDRIVLTLSVTPQGGPMYKPPTRYFVVSGYVAFYEVDAAAATVVILHVVHSRTDWRG